MYDDINGLYAYISLDCNVLYRYERLSLHCVGNIVTAHRFVMTVNVNFENPSSSIETYCCPREKKLIVFFKKSTAKLRNKVASFLIDDFSLRI